MTTEPSARWPGCRSTTTRRSSRPTTSRHSTDGNDRHRPPAISSARLIALRRRRADGRQPAGRRTTPRLAHWHWHSPEPIATTWSRTAIGHYDMTERMRGQRRRSTTRPRPPAITAARKATNKAIMDMHEDITQFQEQFNGPFPFTTNGIIIALPSVGFAEEMQTKITFPERQHRHPSARSTTRTCTSGGATTSPRPWYNLTFWKEGYATSREYLYPRARRRTPRAAWARPPATRRSRPASSPVHRDYNTTSTTFWTSRRRTRRSAACSPPRHVQPPGPVVHRAAGDPRRVRLRKIGVMREILSDYGGGSITQAQLRTCSTSGCRTRASAATRSSTRSSRSGGTRRIRGRRSREPADDDRPGAQRPGLLQRRRRMSARRADDRLRPAGGADRRTRRTSTSARPRVQPSRCRSPPQASAPSPARRSTSRASARARSRPRRRVTASGSLRHPWPGPSRSTCRS